MEVKETIRIDSEHSIEFGNASWDSSEQSIRRRKNNSTGTYDPFSSSEIPIESGIADIAMLLCECLKRDKISKKEMADILAELLKSSERQGYTVSIV